MLLKVKLIKTDHLLPILNQINHNIQFTMEKSQTFSRYNDKHKWYKKWMDIYNKPVEMSHSWQNIHGIVEQTYRLSCKRNMYHRRE